MSKWLLWLLKIYKYRERNEHQQHRPSSSSRAAAAATAAAIGSKIQNCWRSTPWCFIVACWWTAREANNSCHGYQAAVVTTKNVRSKLWQCKLMSSLFRQTYSILLHFYTFRRISREIGCRTLKTRCLSVSGIGIDRWYTSGNIGNLHIINETLDNLNYMYIIYIVDAPYVDVWWSIRRRGKYSLVVIQVLATNYSVCVCVCVCVQVCLCVCVLLCPVLNIVTTSVTK